MKNKNRISQMKYIYKQKYLDNWQMEWYVKKHPLAPWLALAVLVLIILWSSLA